MAEVKESSILIQDVETRNIMTKSALPVGGYSVNPYVGCTHGDRKSTRLNSSHRSQSRMPSSA